MISAAFVFCFFGLLSAQTRISDEKLEVRGDSVFVSFTAQSGKGIPSRYKEVIVPYMTNGSDTLFLAAVEVYGKGRYMRSKQEKYIKGDRHWELGEGQILKGESLDYVSAVPLKKWMTSADLGLKRYLSGCNCDKDYSDETLSRSNRIFKMPPLPQRRIPDYVLTDVARKWDLGREEHEIIFKVSRTEIDSSVFENEKTFGSILDAVDKICSNPHYRMDMIEIAGYASPEGRRGFNRWLGENRARALMNYIISHRPQYALTERNFSLHNGEENWQGLRRRLIDSSIEGKEQVLAIIDSKISDEDKKKAIKAIDRGKVWKKMLAEVYPHLRCARYLSVSYEFSDDSVAVAVNEANELIRKGEYTAAYERMIRNRDDHRVYNSIGVALMMQGKFEEAMPWFEKASESNDPSARVNMDAIKAEYEYEALQRQIIEEYLKKYE